MTDTQQQQEDEIVLEQTLFSETGVWFYQVPPTHVSTLSPRADAWDPEHPFLTGAVRVVQRGDACYVRLFEPATSSDDASSSSSSSPSTLFAQCPVAITRELGLDAYVQDCVDSSRYFMVRVEDETTQRRAYVGVGFPERASAFNFKAALQDHVKYVLRQLEVESSGSSSSGGEASPGRKSQAFSLLEGQTMRINLKLNGMDSDKLQRRRSNSGGDGASGSGGGGGGGAKVPLIPPPPGDLTSSAASATGATVSADAFKTAQTQAASVVADDGEDWGDFTSA